MLSGKFLMLGILHGIFGGLIFGSEIILGFDFAPIRSSASLEIASTTHCGAAIFVVNVPSLSIKST